MTNGFSFIPPNTNQDELFQWVARRLGAPHRDVSELCLENYQDGLENAYLWFVAKKGLKKQKLVPVIANKNEYDIHREISDDVDTVIDISFPSSNLDFSYLYTPFIFPDQQIPFSALAPGFASAQGIFSTFVQNVQYIEMAKRIMGTEPEFQQDGNILRIYPVPSSSFGTSSLGSMLITYKSNKISLGDLNARDFDLIRRRTLAHVKRDLGMIRDRYGSTFIGASGQTPQDGSRLLREADTEMAQLDQEIELSGFPLPILVN